MPELDGWEAAIAIRTHEQFTNMPIIAITAYSLKGDQERAKAAGCNAFHCKPVEFGKLLIDINQLLEMRSP
jgi:two-component system, cell cycle response regulator DivK